MNLSETHVRKARWLGDERGATAIEFAFVAPILLAIVFGAIEMGVLGLMSNAFDNAVAYSARTIRTGQSDGPTSASVFKDQICARMPGTLSQCRARVTVSVRKFASFSALAAGAAAAPDGSFDKGQATDIILVKATYRWPLLSPNLSGFASAGHSSVLLDTQMAFKNEPYV